MGLDKGCSYRGLYGDLSILQCHNSHGIRYLGSCSTFSIHHGIWDFGIATLNPPKPYTLNPKLYALSPKWPKGPFQEILLLKLNTLHDLRFEAFHLSRSGPLLGFSSVTVWFA